MSISVRPKTSDLFLGRPRRGCGKKCYPSRRLCDAAIEAVLASGLHTGKPGKPGKLESYFCKECGPSWHMGHSRCR